MAPSFGRGRLVYRGRMVHARYHFDRAGFRKIAVGSDLRGSVRRLAREEAIPYAQSVSPARSGNYRRSFKVKMSVYLSTRYPMLRVSAEMYNDARHPFAKESYATVIELGQRGVRQSRVFAKTLAFLRRPNESLLRRR